MQTPTRKPNISPRLLPLLMRAEAVLAQPENKTPGQLAAAERVKRAVIGRSSRLPQGNNPSPPASNPSPSGTPRAGTATPPALSDTFTLPGVLDDRQCDGQHFITAQTIDAISSLN